MILDIPVVADWLLIQEHRQQLIDQRLITDNRGRFSHDYHVGDNVLILTHDPATLQDRATGPYSVVETHVNGTVTIQRAPGVLERINIRRVRPYRERRREEAG